MATEKPGHFLSGKRIYVAGGGIAGAAFVSALNQLWDPSQERPQVTILERENRESSILKDPYTLSINGGSEDKGLVALQDLGLLPLVQSHAIPNSGIIRVWSDNWKQLATINPGPHGNLPPAMRIPRQDLKRILIENVEKTQAIWRWASACTAAERLSNGQIRVTVLDTKDGSTFTEDCDLLVAADGLSSNIRASLRPHDMKLDYAGATQIGGISRIASGLPQPVHEDYGLQMSSGEGICCIYTPFDKERIGWALSRLGLEREASVGPLAPAEFESLKIEALKTGPMLNEPFKSIVEATDPATAYIRPAKEKQAFPHDSRLRGVMFIGDANHVLSPFVLDGANLALKDGWDLAEQICRNASLKASVSAYDKLSIPRFDHVIKFSHERIRFGHSTGLMWKVYKYGMTAQRAMAKK